MFCPTSALTGGGVRASCRLPSQSGLHSSLPPTASEGAQSAPLGWEPTRLQETRGAPSLYRHGNAGLAGASGWMIDVGGPARAPPTGKGVDPTRPPVNPSRPEHGNPIVPRTHLQGGKPTTTTSHLPRPGNALAPPATVKEACASSEEVEQGRKAQSCSPPARERHVKGLRRIVLQVPAMPSPFPVL